MSANGKDYRTSVVSRSSSSEDPDPQGFEYMVPKGKHIPVAEGDFVQKGDYIHGRQPCAA